MPKTAGDWLAQTTDQLRSAGITSARLDVLIMLEDVLGKNRAQLLAHPELLLSAEQLDILHTYTTRRAQHTPLAYIRGKAPFYGRDFMVDAHVLVPRPETESMITMLKDLPLTSTPRIADIGSGSGCIAITAALELPTATVYAYDIDEAALAITRRNAAHLQATIHTDIADLLTAVAWPFDVILANLPYVPDGYSINEAAKHEPALALFAGDDGLNLYRVFWQQITSTPSKPRFVLTESLGIQHGKLAALAKAAGYTPTATTGLIQQFELR